MKDTLLSEMVGEEGEAGPVCEFLVHDLQGYTKAMRCVGESEGKLRVEAEQSLKENTLGRFRLELCGNMDLFLVVESCQPKAEGGFALELRPFEHKTIEAARQVLYPIEELSTPTPTRTTAQRSSRRARLSIALTLNESTTDSLSSALTTGLVSCAALFCALLQQLP